ncbi:BACON domain-containing protein [Dysgonomonas reticulitermitis]
MKKILIIIISGILFFSCSDNDAVNNVESAKEFALSKETVNLANIEGSGTISVISGGSWTATVESGADWISLSPSSGNGDSPIRIMVTDNTNGDTRKGKIKVSQSLNGSTTSKELEVNQLGANPDILIEYSKDILPFQGGEILVSITSNTEWEVSIDEGYNWITAEGKENVKAAFITEECKLIIAPNLDVKRTGKVVIRSKEGYVINRIVEITQEESVAFLSLQQDEFIVPFRCETLTIPIDLGEYATKYSISTEEDWITWDEEASTSTQVVLKLNDNDQSDFPRTANVKITNVTLSETVTLFQYGKPNPRIGDDISVSPLAFPGAEGGGRFTTGGRGGIVYRVTNLNDYAKNEASIPGSLRYGLDLAEPKIIVFDVSGTIELKRKLGIVQPNVSIIGQTAPGDGITLKNYQLEIGSNIDNVLIRFIRCRTGDEKSDHEDDGISGRWFKQAIIDHVSSSWCVDECVSFYGVKDFTVQWTIGSESLNESQHEKGAHGYGGIWSGANASFHHMLLAHHGSRVPRIADLDANGPSIANDYHGYFDVRNNVYYNWSGDGQGAYGGANATFNLVNSYYKAGPATNSKASRILSSDPTARIFAEGNHTTANPDTFNDNWTYGIWNEFFHTLNPTEAEKQAMKMNEPFPFDKTTTHSAEDAYFRVSEYAGASLRRDAVDKRIINELLTATTTYRGSISSNPKPGIIDKVTDTNGYPVLKSLPAPTDTDRDGIPDIWEDAYGLDKNNASDANSYNLDNLGRYSNLEIYFHNLIQHIVYYQNQNGVLKEKK